MPKTSSGLHVKDGVITGKTVTTRHNDGCVTRTNYKAEGSGIGRTLFGPSYRAQSTTTTNRDGGSKTKTYR